jgi:hypothetical protein
LSAPNASSSNTITFTFPKDLYFHWPLQDEAILRITASTSCADVLLQAGPFTSTGSFSLNGYAYIANVSEDAAAGNRYQEIIYETTVNDICYHISLYNHGVNGAGFYVEGEALIQKYDNQHDKDIKAVISILNSITSSLRVQAKNVVQ